MTTGSGSGKGQKFSRLLRINSENRQSGTSTDFVIELGQSLQLVDRISIVSCTFPNVFYNVYNTQFKRNNEFTVATVGWAQKVTVPPGWYTINTLIAKLQELFLTLPTPLTLAATVNSINGKVTINISSPAIDAVITPVTTTSSYNWLFWLMGFDERLIQIGTVAGAKTATSVPRMGGPQILYIQSSKLSPGNAFDEKGLQADVAIPIIVTAAHGELNVFECKQDILCELVYGKPRPMNTIDIQLVDHEGLIEDLNGATLNLELRVWFNTF